MHPLVALAKKTVEEYCRNGYTIDSPEKLTPEMKERAGVFVSLKSHGQLRGCIGTFAPTSKNIAEEVIKNAIAASTQDSRFCPVQEDELKDIAYSVDVLSSPERISDKGALDPKRFGIIVGKGHLKGLLLPDLEGVDTVEEQLRIAKMKAGIPPSDEDYEMYCFGVKRYY